jgi:hypothetical protein
MIKIVPDEGRRFEPGDLLLLDTDAATWEAGSEVLRSRICVVKLRHESVTTLVLVRWGSEAEFEGKKLEFPTGSPRSPFDLDDPSVVRRPALEFPDEEPGPAEPARLYVAMTDVVAVLILMLRPPESFMND